MDRDRFKASQSYQPAPPRQAYIPRAQSSQEYQVPVRTAAAPAPTPVAQPTAAATEPAPIATTPQPAADAAAKEVTININLPKVSVPKVSRPQFAAGRTRSLKRPAMPAVVKTHRKLSTGLALFVILSGVGAAGYGLLPDAKNTATVTTTQAATAGQAVARAQPSFKPVVPKSKPELATPTAGTSSYDGAKDVYSYYDTFNGTRLTVSQQPVPAGAGSISDMVATIGSKLGAKEQLKLSDGSSAFIQTDKYGSQTIVLGVNNVVIFVKSGFKHSAIEWSNYLNTLVR